ncbi:MAG TPA: DUF420 domain-containing protein [Candidatus Binataceae bacterium]
MPHYSSLAPLNAALNAGATVLLIAGLFFIKRKQVRAHRACMIGAVALSGAFLTSYLTYHYHLGDVRFGGEGLIRPVYFAILIPHIILAGAIVPLVLITLWQAVRGHFVRHRKIARWTWPLWIYVSVTGVIIYFMLYQFYPPRMTAHQIEASSERVL